ncbi:MAG TPA: hypothetical protein VMT49_01900 [Steroidobacteraceae bacterium]|nr:hypothetical protein [Steroidobacteraceae bacterium]
MSPQFRPTTPDDALQLQVLAASAFESRAPLAFVDRAMLQWKFWSPRPDFARPRSYVVESQGRIVAHAGLWPVTVDGLAGVHLIDWMAAPDEPGAGVFLHQHMAEQFDFQLSIGGAQAALEILPALGFTPIGTAWSWARPLRPLRQIAHHQQRNWRLAPRYLRNLSWSLWPRRRGDDGHACTLVPDCSNAQRSAAFFEYLRGCPGAQVLCFSIADASGPVGEFALAVVALQARIAGIWLQRPTVENWTLALECAQRAALAHSDACEIVFRAAAGASRLAAPRAGMHLVATEQVCTRGRDGAAVHPALDFQLCDNDAVFLTQHHAPRFST